MNYDCNRSVTFHAVLLATPPSYIFYSVYMLWLSEN